MCLLCTTQSEELSRSSKFHSERVALCLHREFTVDNAYVICKKSPSLSKDLLIPIGALLSFDRDPTNSRIIVNRDGTSEVPPLSE